MLNSIDKIIKHKTGLLNLAEEPDNVSKACQVMGMSHDTFYRYTSAVGDGGVEALFERTRRKPNLANRMDQATEDAVDKIHHRFPGLWPGPHFERVAQAGCVCLTIGCPVDLARHSLANFKDRLKAQEAKPAEEGEILTEAQVQALKRRSTMTMPAAR